MINFYPHYFSYTQVWCSQTYFLSVLLRFGSTFFLTRLPKTCWTCLCFCVLEPSEANSRNAEQHSRAHHWPGAASASNQHHPALTRSHGGQRPNPTLMLLILYNGTVCVEFRPEENFFFSTFPQTNKKRFSFNIMEIKEHKCTIKKYLLVRLIRILFVLQWTDYDRLKKRFLKSES